MELDPDITLNPPFSQPHLVLLFLILAVVFGWAAWKSTARARTQVRLLTVVCRVLLVLALLVVFLNPGRWIENREDTDHHWALLTDSSQSMQTRDGGKDPSRWEAAINFTKRALREAGDTGTANLYTFDRTLNPVEPGRLGDEAPQGEQTDLISVSDNLLSVARNRSGRFNGAIILTDGRQTVLRQDVERTALRARAGESPFYILPIGGEVVPVDLSLESARRQFVAFAGQDCTVTARIQAEGLGAVRPEIVLHGPDGTEMARQQVELQEGENTEVRFTFPAPDAGIHLLEFRTAEWPGERITANNAGPFTLNVLDGTTKIFMAEGAPYWDSKFLAQMIRNQENMEITSVYRLSSDRFFRVSTGDAQPSQETENSFPSTAEELGQYDLIVLGKGIEYFLDEKRLALISDYVRDRGGSILFTRGKPYRGTFEGIEFLEPAKWGDEIREPLLLEPTAAGEAAGLFGELLPGADDPVWQELPEITNSHQCLELKPFTEVLLQGKWSLDGRGQDLPILMSRRFGRGVTVMLNADGLWKWDFFPTDKGIEGQYEEFWGQLIQWAITFSEFLPGQDLSLHLDQSIVRPGDPVRARIGYRGSSDVENPARPALRIFQGNEMIREVPASLPTETSARWEAGFTLQTPGTYRIEAYDAANAEKPGPSLPVTVLPPPSETEQLSADPVFLETFAGLTGGRLITAEELPDIVSELSTSKESVDRAKAVWKPLWDQWWTFSIVLFIASLEWFTRRRSGLL